MVIHGYKWLAISPISGYKWLRSCKWDKSYKYLSHLIITTYIFHSRWYSYISMVITLRGLRGLSKWVIELIRVLTICIEVTTQHVRIYSALQPLATPTPPQMVLGGCTLSQNGYGNASKHVLFLGLMGLINYVINGYKWL